MIGNKAPAKVRLKRGALIRVQADAKGNWQIVQLPQVESALVSVDTDNGATGPLVGASISIATRYNHVSIHRDQGRIPPAAAARSANCLRVRLNTDQRTAFEPDLRRGLVADHTA